MSKRISFFELTNERWVREKFSTNEELHNPTPIPRISFQTSLGICILSRFSAQAVASKLTGWHLPKTFTFYFGLVLPSHVRGVLAVLEVLVEVANLAGRQSLSRVGSLHSLSDLCDGLAGPGEVAHKDVHPNFVENMYGVSKMRAHFNNHRIMIESKKMRKTTSRAFKSYMSRKLKSYSRICKD